MHFIIKVSAKMKAIKHLDYAILFLRREALINEDDVIVIGFKTRSL